MQEFNGDLLLGGSRLKHVHGELKSDEPLPDSSEHLLAGRLEINSAQQTQLQVGRMYRLEIDHGPAGMVVVSRIDAAEGAGAVAEFEPPPAAKPR